MNEDCTYNYLHPLSFATTKGDNETYNSHPAMQQDDRGECINAMIKEISYHTTMKHCKVINRNVICDAKTIKAIWPFKLKRRSDFSLIKYKARLCAHGGM